MTDFSAAGASITGIVRESSPTTRQWILFAALAIAATSHMVFTRPTEERQRAARLSRGKVEHVDQTSIWLFSAALLLPVTLVVTLVILVRAQRYRIARRPPWRWMFNSSAILLSGLGVHWIGMVTGLSRWLSSGHDRVISATSLIAIAGVVAAIAMYFLVQAVVVGVFRGLQTRGWTFENTLGTWSDNV
ncbi:MAG TPA: GGDEF domain-containing protein, partial [Pseudonocardiaceae bacterium]